MLVWGRALDVRLGLIALWVPLCQRNALGVHFLRVTLVFADPAVRERTLRRGLRSAHPALQASTLLREPPPAPPAQAAREAFPAAAPA